MTESAIQKFVLVMMAKRFLVIDCNTANLETTAWKPRDFCDMFRDACGDPDDCWETCRLACGEELPSDIMNFQGVVITGSVACVRDALSWFGPLCEFVRNASSEGTPNVYGGCFGCQITAHALGGVVGGGMDISIDYIGLYQAYAKVFICVGLYGALFFITSHNYPLATSVYRYKSRRPFSS